MLVGRKTARRPELLAASSAVQRGKESICCRNSQSGGRNMNFLQPAAARPPRATFRKSNRRVESVNSATLQILLGWDAGASKPVQPRDFELSAQGKPRMRSANPLEAASACSLARLLSLSGSPRPTPVNPSECTRYFRPHLHLPASCAHTQAASPLHTFILSTASQHRSVLPPC